MEHFVQVDDHPEDIAEGEHHNDGGQYDGNALVSPLPGGCPLVHAACPLHCLVQHRVEDREYDEGDEDHHHEVGHQDVVSDVVIVVPGQGGPLTLRSQGKENTSKLWAFCAVLCGIMA